MGFSDTDQMLIENLYILKAMEWKNSLQSFHINIC